MSFLGLFWLAVFLIDIVNPADYRVEVFERVTGLPAVFFWGFREGGPVERAQWMLLGTTAVLCASVALIARRRRTPGLILTFLVGVLGFMLMLMEDALNVRYWIAFELAVPLLEGDPMILRSLSDLAVYSLLASLMLFFFLRVHALGGNHLRFRRHLWLGYAAYGVAALASATRYIGDYYERVGVYLLRRISPDLLDAFQPGWGIDQELVGFWFMDLFLEESLELVGASALCAAILRIWILNREGEVGRPEPGKQQVEA